MNEDVLEVGPDADTESTTACVNPDVDHELVSDLESIDNIFPDIDYTIYSASPMASAILDT